MSTKGVQEHYCQFCKQVKRTDVVKCLYCEVRLGGKVEHRVCDDCWARMCREGHPEVESNTQ